jgi:hypothetical protein
MSVISLSSKKLLNGLGLAVIAKLHSVCVYYCVQSPLTTIKISASFYGTLDEMYFIGVQLNVILNLSNIFPFFRLISLVAYFIIFRQNFLRLVAVSVGLKVSKLTFLKPSLCSSPGKLLTFVRFFSRPYTPYSTILHKIVCVVIFPHTVTSVSMRSICCCFFFDSLRNSSLKCLAPGQKLN